MFYVAALKQEEHKRRQEELKRREKARASSAEKALAKALQDSKERVVELETKLATCNTQTKRRLKGYLSHQHAKLVVSKGNAFPPLREVLGGEAE